MSKKNSTAANLSAPTPEQWAELQKQLAAKDAALEKMRTEQESGIVLKISQWGALQINGLRQGYVGFYRDEWEKILSMTGRIQEYLEEHPPVRDDDGKIVKGSGVLEKAESYAEYPADMRKK